MAPESPMVPVPAVAVITPPPHDPVRPFGVAMVSPVGSASTNATPVSAIALAVGLDIVNVNAEFVFGAMTAGLKFLEIEGGATTSTLADAVPPLPP